MFLISYLNNLIVFLTELKGSSTQIGFFFKLVGIVIAFVVLKETISFFINAFSIYSKVRSTSKESNDRYFIFKSALRMGLDELSGFVIMFFLVLLSVFILTKLGLNIVGDGSITALFI